MFVEYSIFVPQLPVCIISFPLPTSQESDEDEPVTLPEAYRFDNSRAPGAHAERDGTLRLHPIVPQTGVETHTPNFWEGRYLQACNFSGEGKERKAAADRSRAVNSMSGVC